MQLHYAKLLPQMKAGRVIQQYKRCYGDEIYISCHNNPGEGEVRVFDISGKLHRRLGNDQYGSFMFTKPYNCIVNTSGNKIFVSEREKDTVVCMIVEGHVIYKFKNRDMKNPRGLFCDSEDIILVCGSGSHNVHVITSNGNMNRTLLSSRDGLKYPYTIALSATDDTLIVGCQNMDDSLLLKLTQ